MLQHLTRGFALRLRYTPSNCISTRRYIELVKIHKTAPLQGLVCVIYFHRQYPCVVILACVKPIKTQRRHPSFFSLLLSFSTHEQPDILPKSRSFFLLLLLLWWIILEAEPARIYCCRFLFIVSDFRRTSAKNNSDSLLCRVAHLSEDPTSSGGKKNVRRLRLRV